jgi:hypothetical protein
MKKMILQILLVSIIVRSHSQVKDEISLNSIIDFRDGETYDQIFYSEKKLYLLSKNNILSLIDLKNKDVVEIIDVKKISSSKITPTSVYIKNDSIFLAFRKNIVYGNMYDKNSFRQFNNKGIVQSLRKTSNALVLCYRNKIKTINLSTLTKDSITLKTSFDGTQEVTSPYINFYLSNEKSSLIPFSNDDIISSSEEELFKLNEFGVKRYPADLYKNYIPKTVSKKFIYWHNSKEPHKFIITDINDVSTSKYFEVDKRIINYRAMLPDIINLSEGDEGSPDFENCVKMTSDNLGAVYLMFKASNKHTKIYSFKIKEDGL